MIKESLDSMISKVFKQPVLVKEVKSEHIFHFFEYYFRNKN